MKLKIRMEPPIKNLVAELEAMEAGLGPKGVRSGLVAGVKPVKAAMKAFVPVDEGHLRKAIGHTSLSRRAKGRLGLRANDAAILVGANSTVAVRGKRYWQGKKAHWIEEGTRHMAAKPFMDRSKAAGDAGFEDRFYKGLTNYVEKQRAKRHPG